MEYFSKKKPAAVAAGFKFLGKPNHKKLPANGK